ncbi:MAG TPA: phage portal protein [Dehalococcoidia bacterium]|nr:phage portal protein [Dehalococcoidia bacterium]
MTTTATITLPERIRRMDGERLRRYADNLAFYNGEQWPAMVRDRRRRLVFNYAKAIIDKTASYLLTGMHVAADPEDGTPEAAARARETEAALADIAAANNLEQLDFDTEVDAAVLGDGAYKVTWDAAERRVRISAPDVQGLFAWHDGDDITRVRRVASRYSIDAETARELYGVQPRAARAARPSPAANGGEPSVEVVESWTDADFELWVDGRQVERQENPYGFIPFVIFPNLREPKKFWGVSDLPAIKEPLRELNRAFTQLSMILELSGNPIAVLENVTESSDIAVVPGAVWELPEHARAYLLDLLQGGGVKLHVDYIEMLYRALHDLGESPRTAFGDNRAALSGVALNIELDPLLKKVSRKRLIRAAAYRRRNEMALRILERFGERGGAGGGAGRGGGRSFAPYRTRIVWGSVLPLDRSRLVEDERALVAAGIHSRRRAADELGVEDPETEFRRWLEERRAVGAVEVGG